MALAGTDKTSSDNRVLNISLWVSQIILAGFYAMAAYMHAIMAPEALVQMGIAWAAEAPLWLVRFIGICELLGVVGIILPAALRIKPQLTVLAAVGFTGIQALAIPFHLFRGEAAALPFNIILIALSLFVIWGRARKAPIATK